jgi:glycerol-3-phosphate acyltransferase PlsX
VSSVLPIVIDAMGGDNAPGEIIRGVVDAATEYKCDVCLVGDEERIEAGMKTLEIQPDVRARIAIVNTSEVIAMDEHPAQAVRQKKDSSLVRACQLVAGGEGSAVISAGNSGAMMAAALFVQKRIDGVSRPAIGALFPSRNKASTFVLDVGANTDCKPEWLLEFAIMGNVYAKTMMGLERPRVGLLSNGEEETKGSQVVLAAHELLREAPVNFIGNVEAKQIFSGTCDVVVCDGFIGNIALKTAEGVGEFLFAAMREQAMSSTTAKIGGALLKPKLRAIRDQIDYRQTGGALLLGVKGETVISHGRSDALAIKNAVRVALQAATANVSGIIASEMSALEPAPVTIGANS